MAPGSPRLVMVDNYDSFTFNLVQYLGELGAAVDVVRNDASTVEALLATAPDGVVISPGPGTPERAGISVDMVHGCARADVPLLGVCLGHQSIGQAFGGTIVRARSIMHGKVSDVQHDGKALFEGLDSPFPATRYHSLVIDPARCPDVLVVTARTADGEIMGVRHVSKPIFGLQFHPESILTQVGKALLGRFLERCGGRRAA